MKHLFALFSCLVLTESLWAQDAAESAISHLQNGINCSREEAERLYRTINFFADGVTSDLTYIASSRDDFATKQKAINRTIRDYFENGNSIIQVSSISKDPENPDIYDFTIRRYLYRLANMKNRYTKVELTFQQDYLGMGQIYPDGQDVELSSSLWQIFRGWKDNLLAYQDATKKKFRLAFKKIGDDKYDVKIKEALATETIDLNKFYQKFKIEDK
jgi:hypothetical protein